MVQPGTAWTLVKHGMRNIRHAIQDPRRVVQMITGQWSRRKIPQQKLKTGELVALSQQQLIDCSTSHGCDGGLMTDAFKYISKNNGIATAASYPYEAREGYCRFGGSTIGATVKSYKNVPTGREDVLQDAVARIGPITAGMDASQPSFTFYRSGIYHENRCSSQSLNHAVLIIGYNETTDGQEHWLVKNSFGSAWGENGYFKISKNRVSNEVPENPVVSPVSNHVFERRLVEKYITENGTDPITGQELTTDQLIDIKASPVVKPRALNAASIPSILKMLQDEWDACMLQSFTMRQQLQTARQELSHALYQHDAACRVIARLTKEVTAAREALATLKPHAALAQPSVQEPAYAAEAGGGAEQPMEEAGMTDDVIKKLQDKAAVLTAARKQRGKTVPEGLTKSDDMKEFKQTATHVGLHSASVPGITALDIQISNPNMILTGGNDKNAVVFDKEKEQVVQVFKGHQKRITGAIFHPDEDICLTASMDASIRVWSVSQTSAQHVIKAHDGPVSAISLHATGDYVLSVSTDEKWAFSDLRTGRILCKIADVQSPQPMTCAQFHPDGLIFGVGTQDSMVKIWDLKEQANVANFPGHTGAIRAISFSENGYYLATAAEDSAVKLWDLRKLKNFKTLTLDDRYQVSDLCFDQSGTYLAMAGTDVRVYLCKQWQELAVLSDHTELATGVRFGRDATYLASTGMDRSLRFYANS